MIEEIHRLREEGLSFRRIAAELNTTVGRVQYRYNKWLISQQEQADLLEEIRAEGSKGLATEPFQLKAKKGELQIKLISPRKILLYWDVNDIPEKITKLFFNRHSAEFVHIARIYDVTDITFNGENAHHVFEMAIPCENGHWFIKGLMENRNYIAETGLQLSENHYFPILRSDVIQTPGAEIQIGNVLYQESLPFQDQEDQPPKWTKHVSTYSYYEEPQNSEDKGHDFVTRI